MQYQNDNLGWLQVADNGLANSADLGVGTGNEVKYDANGNFLSLKRGTTTYSYTYEDGTNKVTGVTKTAGTGNVVANYNYDAIGNITSSSGKNLSGISYDAFTNMTSGLSEGTIR